MKGFTRALRLAKNRNFRIFSRMNSYRLPQVVAHRTNAGGCPENSLSGIRAAMALGVDMVELDLQRSSDGRLVLMHDHDIARTTDGKGELRSFTYEQLSRFRLRSKTHPPEGIPLFEQVLQLVQEADIRLILELKSPGKFPGIGEEVVQLLERYGMRERVAVISFDSGFLTDFKRKYPDIYVASLSLFPLGPKASSQFDGVGIFHGGLLLLGRRKWLRRLLRLDSIAVYVFTANSEKALRKLLKMEVEGIITDKPELLLKLLRESHY